MTSFLGLGWNNELAQEARQFIKIQLEQFRKGEDVAPEKVIEILKMSHYFLSYSSSDLDYNLGLAVICHVSQVLPNDSLARMLLHDCIVASRNFLYLDMLEKMHKDYSSSLGPLEQFQLQYYRTDLNSTLTKQQKEIFERFGETGRLVVSAPTSFGKTKLLQEIILQKSYDKVVVIMPTLALIAETVYKFRKDERFSEYVIINSTSVASLSGKLIYVLTPEKLDLLLDGGSGIYFDFFAFDEIYKIQDEADRKPVFANVLYRMMRSNADFYLIGPYFKRFSPAFIKRSGAEFMHFSTEIVQKDVVEIFRLNRDDVFSLDGKNIKKSPKDEKTLERIVDALDEQQLIYQNTKRGVESLAKNLARGEVRYSSPLIDYIKETISDSWRLVYCLERGVGFHHGSMPRYIQSALVRDFNEGDIKTLVCTTTLTEGVNTTAKNVIIFSNLKGTKNLLSGFDFKNIKGRAGRFLEHFVGRVLTFHNVEEAERDFVSFHYFDDLVLDSDEVLHIQDEDLTPASKTVRENTISVLKDNSIPESLVRKNKYIQIHKQISLVNRFRRDRDCLHGLLFQSNLPTKTQLKSILELSFEILFNDQDFNSKNFRIWTLSKLVNYYVYHRPSIRELIAAQEGKTIDTRIRNAFSLISHYFEFALPKYLNCFEVLANHVASEFGMSGKVKLGFLITMLQYGFTNPNEIALKDSGLPDDIIKKLSKSTSDCRSLEEIRLRFRMRPDLLQNLSQFERELVNRLT